MQSLDVKDVHWSINMQQTKSKNQVDYLAFGDYCVNICLHSLMHVNFFGLTSTFLAKKCWFNMGGNDVNFNI